MAEHELNKIVDDEGEVFNLRDSTKQPVADRVTAWGSTPSDTKYPSEKLVKTSLDAKVSSIKKNDTTFNPSEGIVNIGYIPTAYPAATNTVQNIIQELRVKPGGSIGSVLVSKDTTISSVTISNRWYNYIWLPHRTGKDEGDLQKFGTLILTPLTETPDIFVIECSGLANETPTYRAKKFAYSDHTHGNITNGGALQTTDVTIANGDKLVVTDASDSNKIARSSVAFDGSTVNKMLTQKGTFETVREGNLEWGGRTWTGSYGPLDAALIDVLGANRFAFGNGDGVTVEYTRDGGTTWTDYGLTKAQKSAVFTLGEPVRIGKNDSNNKATADANWNNYKARITIQTGTFGVYTYLLKLAIYCSTNGSQGTRVVITARTRTNEQSDGAWTSIATESLSGWSGWNIIPVSFTTWGNTGSQYSQIRFLFEATQASSEANKQYNGFSVSKIFGYGGVGWTVPSTMAASGHMYTYDIDKNVSFPARLTATSFNGKFTTARKLAVSLSNTSTDTSFDGSADVTNIKTTGTLGITNGGTGKTTAFAASNALLGGMNSETSDVTDDTVTVYKYVSPSDSTGALYSRKASAFWTYIKGKISSVLGLSESGYTGNAATATTVKSVELTSGDDLNDYKGSTFGETTVYKWFYSTRPAHCPAEATSTMFVVNTLLNSNSTKYTKQLVFVSGENKIYERSYSGNNDTWTDWQTVVLSGDVTSTYSSTGTAPVNGTAVASAINALDVASQGGDGKYIKAISESNGKISATAETMDTAPTKDSTKAVTSGGVQNGTVAIADAYVRRGSDASYLSYWCCVAEATFTSAQNAFCSSWLVTITSRNNGSRTESFFLNFALQAGTSGTAAPSACNFYTSPIKRNANNTRAFKAIVNGTSGNYTIKIYYTAGGMDRSGMTMKELNANAAYSNADTKGSWTYHSYGTTDAGESTEPTGDYGYACEWNCVQPDWEQTTNTADDYIRNKPLYTKSSGSSAMIYEVCTLPYSAQSSRGYGIEFIARYGNGVVEGKLLGRAGVELYMKGQGARNGNNKLTWYSYSTPANEPTTTTVYVQSATYVDLRIVKLNNHSGLDMSRFGTTVSELPEGATAITPRWEASCTASSNGNPVAVNEFGEMSIASAVRYDSNAQGLTDTQKLNARTNIGISNSDTVFIYPIDTTEPNVWPKFLAAYNDGKQMFATYWEGVTQGIARKRILPLVGVTTETTNNTPTSFTFGMPYCEDTDSNFGRLVRWTLGISTGWVLSELDVTYADKAGLATKATNDGSGNEIESSYKKKTYADAFTTSQQIAVSNATYAYWYIGNSYKRIRVGVSGNGNVSIGEETGKSASPTSATDIIKSSGTGDATTYNFYGKASDSTKWNGYSIVVGSVGTDSNTIYFL